MARYYIFALFVFLLAVITLLIAKLIFKKEKNTFLPQEEKLLKLYSQIEDMMDSFEEYAGEVKNDIKESGDDIKIYLEKFRRELEETYGKNARNGEKPTEKSPKAENTEKTASAGGRRQSRKTAQKTETKQPETKNETVKRLYSEGMSVNEIARKLNITVAEINLIIKID